MFHWEGVNNLLEAFLVEDLHLTIFPFLCPSYLLAVPLGHSGVANRGGTSVVGNPGFSSSTNGIGGSVSGYLPASVAIGNRNLLPGLGVSPILGNPGPWITSSMGNMVGGGNNGRSISSGGGLSVPGLTSHLNLSANYGSGGLNMQG